MYERRSERRATEGEDQEREEVSSRAAMRGSEDGMKRKTDSLTCFTDYDLPRLQIGLPCTRKTLKLPSISHRDMDVHFPAEWGEASIMLR